MEYEILVPLLVLGAILALLVVAAFMVFIIAWLQDFGKHDDEIRDRYPWEYYQYWNKKKLAWFWSIVVVGLLLLTGFIPGWVQ